MRVDQEGLIVSYSKRDMFGKRLVIPKTAIGFADNLGGEIYHIAVHPKEKIVVEEGNPVFYMQDGCLIDRTTKTLLLAEIGAKMPKDGSIEHIGKNAFGGHSELGGTLIIPDGVKSIGYAAFSDCTGIVRVGIPKSVTRIEGAVFNGCSAVRVFSVQAGNPNYYAEKGCLIRRRSRRLIAGSVASVIPENVTGIADCAFDGLVGLERIVVPNSVKSIGECAFAGCKNLKRITLPDGLTRLAGDAFFGCDALESIAIPNGVKYINYFMFKECAKLKEVTIPESVTSIEFSAFEDCTALEEIDIPQSVEVIGTWAFYNCKNLKKITLAEGLKVIYREAFAGCAFQEIVLPASLKEIDEGVFLSCTHLREIVIPKNVKRIGVGAFYVCTNLKSAVFEDPCGWVYNGRPLKEEELRDPATAAEFLTHKYRHLIWEKKKA